MYAAALIPLLGLLGRHRHEPHLFAKTRLQQACDAGALAGRKQMAGDYGPHNGEPTPSHKHVHANFQSGAYGTTG